MKGGIYIFIYPENLSEKPKLWLWHLKDVALIGIFGMISLYLYMQLSFVVPGSIVITYAIMTVRFDNSQFNLHKIDECTKEIELLNQKLRDVIVNNESEENIIDIKYEISLLNLELAKYEYLNQRIKSTEDQLNSSTVSMNICINPEVDYYGEGHKEEDVCSVRNEVFRFDNKLNSDQIEKILTRFNKYSEEQCLQIGKRYYDNYKDFGATSWHHWCIGNWGTKWNACELYMASEDIIVFYTAWNHPEPIIQKISELFDGM